MAERGTLRDAKCRVVFYDYFTTYVEYCNLHDTKCERIALLHVICIFITMGMTNGSR